MKNEEEKENKKKRRRNYSFTSLSIILDLTMFYPNIPFHSESDSTQVLLSQIIILSVWIKSGVLIIWHLIKKVKPKDPSTINSS